jgi:hypothetical protein
MSTTERRRYGHESGSGSNEPKGHEKKEQRPDWVSRQGGDQTSPDERPSDEAQGKHSKPPADVLTRRHVEGAEQGPS